MTQLTVLHVDDEPDIREVAALALELDPGVTLTSAASGQEALDVLAGGLRPDVVLLDVMMPLMDGPTTLERLRTMAGLETTPVVFMTARVQTAEQERYLALGAVGVIVKPFDPMLLAQDLRSLLASRAA